MQTTDVLARSIRDTNGMTRTEAKTQALSWLATQLKWEHMLEVLRDDEHEPASKAA